MDILPALQIVVSLAEGHGYLNKENKPLSILEDINRWALHDDCGVPVLFL